MTGAEELCDLKLLILMNVDLEEEMWDVTIFPSLRWIKLLHLELSDRERLGNKLKK